MTCLARSRHQKGSCTRQGDDDLRLVRKNLTGLTQVSEAAKGLGCLHDW